MGIEWCEDTTCGCTYTIKLVLWDFVRGSNNVHCGMIIKDEEYRR